MTRAEYILNLHEGVISGAVELGKTIAPHAGKIGLAGAAAGVVAGHALRKAERNRKLKQTSHSGAVQKSKDRLTLARVKSAKTLGLSKKRRQAVKDAKVNKRKTVNKALHQYNKEVQSGKIS